MKIPVPEVGYLQISCWQGDPPGFTNHRAMATNVSRMPELDSKSSLLKTLQALAEGPVEISL